MKNKILLLFLAFFVNCFSMDWQINNNSLALIGSVMVAGGLENFVFKNTKYASVKTLLSFGASFLILSRLTNKIFDNYYNNNIKKEHEGCKQKDFSIKDSADLKSLAHMIANIKKVSVNDLIKILVEAFHAAGDRRYLLIFYGWWSSSFVINEDGDVQVASENDLMCHSIVRFHWDIDKDKPVKVIR